MSYDNIRYKDDIMYWGFFIEFAVAIIIIRLIFWGFDSIEVTEDRIFLLIILIIAILLIIQFTQILIDIGKNLKFNI